MIVPISSSTSGPTAMGSTTSESNLLMALATMHNLGKFNTPPPFPSKLRPPKPAKIGGEE